MRASLHPRVAPGGGRAAGALLLSGLVLAGCAMFQEAGPPLPCPRTVTVADAARLTRFDDAGHDLTDVLFEAEIAQIASACEYDEGAVDVTVQVQFVAQRDRRTDAAVISTTVAIADAGQTILVRESFDATIEFPGNKTQAGVVEELEQHIPLGADEPGAGYVIYVGFVLTPDEVAYNRQNSR
jgi:hypothetical protein